MAARIQPGQCRQPLRAAPPPFRSDSGRASPPFSAQPPPAAGRAPLMSVCLRNPGVDSPPSRREPLPRGHRRGGKEGGREGRRDGGPAPLQPRPRPRPRAVPQPRLLPAPPAEGAPRGLGSAEPGAARSALAAPACARPALSSAEGLKLCHAPLTALQTQTASVFYRQRPSSQVEQPFV